MPSSREPSWARDWTLVSCVSCIGRQVLYHYCHVGSPCSLQSTFTHLISFVLFNHLGCFWTMLLGKPLESLGLQGDQTSQSWRKSILNIHWKDWCWSCYTLATWYEEQTHQKRPDAGKDWRQEEKGMTEDETVGWHDRLNGHEFEQTARDGEGQRTLACCSPWGCKETWLSDWTTTKRDNSKILAFPFYRCIQKPRRLNQLKDTQLNVLRD